MECIYERYIKDFRCKYYILKRTSEYVGIKIEKLNSNGQVIEESTVENVDKDERKVRKILAKINKARVTPMTLSDIVMDNFA